MNINSVKSGASVYKATESKENKTLENEDSLSKVKGRLDSVEISAEAKRLNAIQARIEQGVYNNPDILDQIATKVLKDL